MIWKNLPGERSVPSDTQQTKEKPMQYLVDMRLVDSGRSTNPQEGLAFVENWIFPTLARCTELQRQGKIVGGGPIGGVIGFALLIEAASVLELDQVIESLPLWPRTHTTAPRSLTSPSVTRRPGSSAPSAAAHAVRATRATAMARASLARLGTPQTRGS